MRYRHNNYSISGQTITINGVTTVNIQDIRLIIDETDKKVICSSMQKDNVTVSGNVITVPSSVATLNAAHKYTIELDFGDDSKGIAREGNATNNKEELKNYMKNVAGIEIVPNRVEECLPFDSSCFCAIYGDADFITGDFAPQISSVTGWAIGDVIKVTGENATQEVYEGYPVGSTMAVAKTIDSENLYRDGDGIMHGITQEIMWAKGKYYRITDKVQYYDENTQDNLTLFLYEEVASASIIDEVDKVGNMLDQCVKDGNDTAIGMLKDNTNGLAAIKGAIGTPASGQASTLFAAIAEGGGGGGSATIPSEVVDNSTSSKALDPNKLYIFTNRTSNLTITLNAGESGVANEYHMIIEVGSTVPTITFPNSVAWIVTPSLSASTPIEISILNNSGLWI